MQRSRLFSVVVVSLVIFLIAAAVLVTPGFRHTHEGDEHTHTHAGSHAQKDPPSRSMSHENAHVHSHGGNRHSHSHGQSHSHSHSQLTFIQGLYNAEALKGNIHSSMTGDLLAGAPLASGGEIRSETSFDQLIAQRYGQSTKVSSLVLGCERSNPGLHKTTRGSTAHIFPGVRRPRRFRSNCIRPWPLTGCSPTARNAVIAASSTLS